MSTKKGDKMSKCYTSDTGNPDDVQVGKHNFDKDGYCAYCGERQEDKDFKKVMDCGKESFNSIYMVEDNHIFEACVVIGCMVLSGLVIIIAYCVA